MEIPGHDVASADRRGRKQAPLIALTGVALLFATGWLWFELRRPTGPDVLLITVDTLRADHLGVYGSTATATPHIDRLATRGLIFDNAAAPVPLTRPSHYALLTARYPRELGALSNAAVLTDTVPTLAEVLQAQGYDTVAFTAVSLLSPESGIDRGFDQFYWPDGESPQLAAETVVGRALGWLRHQPARRPFFAWVHLFDPHQPYAPKAPFDEATRSRGVPIVDFKLLQRVARNHDGDIPESFLWHSMRLYAGEVEYTDHWIGKLLDGLADTGRLEDALVVLTADHGECFEQGVYFEHSDCLFDGAVRVPLIVRPPRGLAESRRIARQVELMDVAPTILSMLEIGLPESFPQRDLLAEPEGESLAFLEHPRYHAQSMRERLERREVIRSVAGQPLRPLLPLGGQTGVRSADWKLLDSEERTELYRNADERHDLSSVERDQLSRLLERLRQWDRSHPFTTSEQTTDPHTLETLRSLGYVR